MAWKTVCSLVAGRSRRGPSQASRPGCSEGLRETEAARVFGVARGTVNRWTGLVGRAGRRALKARRRGWARVLRSARHQAATTLRHILSGCPDQLSLPFALWTIEAQSRCCESSICRFRCGRWNAICEPGSDSAETGATSVRTKSGRRTEMAGGRISIYSRTGATVPGPDLLARRDGVTFGSLSGMILGLRGHRRGNGDWSALSLQHDLFDHQSGAVGLHDFRQGFTALVFINFPAVSCA